MSDNSVEQFNEVMEQGMRLARAYQWANAVDAYRKAVALVPGSEEARFRLGWALWNLADSEKPTIADLAIVYGAQALGLEQTARDGRRRVQFNRQLLKDAIFYLNSVIDRDSTNARAYHYLARTFQALDMRPEAEEAARKAAELEPGNANYTNLAQNFERTLPSPEVPKPGSAHTWDDLVLDPRTKRELKQMQLLLEKPDLAKELGIHPPTGILLKGPPGTGKTTVARILAHESKCNFFAVSPPEIIDSYVGESEKRVRELFVRARANAPAIIFIDEIDALLPIRQGGVAIHSDKVVNQFLQEMDGMTPNARIFVVGATNRPDMLDPAVRRGGRLSREIEIPVPDHDARIQLFKLSTRNSPLSPDVDIEELSRLTDGYSGADIKALVSEAGLMALIRIADENNSDPRCLSMADFRMAIINLG